MIRKPSKIETYIQDRPAEWLKDHPHERWRCDIFPGDGSDHHGIGATEPEAVMNACMAYLKWIKSPDRQVRQVRPDGSFPGMTFRSERPSAADKVWTTPSSEDAYKDGKLSGLSSGRRGVFYMAGGPWVPKAMTYNADEAWNAYVNQCALVNAEWLRGWKDGQAEAKQVSLEPQPQPDTDAQLQGHMFGDLALARYRTLAAKLETAAVNRSWCGSRPASEWAAIREEHAQARRDLEAFVKSLIDGGPQRT